jgi:hypothetical protein
MFIQEEGKTIAVDFDGTIVEHAYPGIGKEMMFAFATLKELQNRGHKLILWSFREGELLNEAVNYCKNQGIEFYAINKSYPEEQLNETTSRKIHADIFIDDRNIGGFPGWPDVFQMLHPESGDYRHQLTNPKAHYNKSEKKSFWKKLLGED